MIYLAQLHHTEDMKITLKLLRMANAFSITIFLNFFNRAAPLLSTIYSVPLSVRSSRRSVLAYSKWATRESNWNYYYRKLVIYRVSV